MFVTLCLVVVLTILIVVGEYYIIKKILDKGLHTNDDECMTYTTTLMDKLEETKTAHPEDAILDDVAAKVYVEQFGLETFQRAETAMNADKATACADQSYVMRIQG